MNLPKLSWKYLTAKPLNFVLNTLILSLGIAIVIILLLLSTQAEDKMMKNAKGVDLVIGAKGSPLQLILCNIFHIDFPTGNIDLEEAQKVARNPMVKYAIPLALGDSYKGFRIVGTNHKYAELYQGNIAEGKLWEKPFEVTIGYTAAKHLQLKLGDTFHGAHGIGEDMDQAHEHHDYRVVGILQPNGSVLDNLIFTRIESVWLSHEDHGESSQETEEAHTHEEHEHEHEHNHDHAHDHEHHHAETHAHEHGPTEETVQVSKKNPLGLPQGEGKEITSMLVKFRSPMAAMQMPRYINSQTSMQAASPAIETARLFSLLGIGVDLLQGFAYLMVFIAVLSIFIALYNALKERKYDLAIMRSLGSSKTSLFILIILEGVLITLISAGFALVIAHGVVELIMQIIEGPGAVGITGFTFLVEELYLIGGALLIGIITSLIPAIQAYKTDISEVLAKG
ncbi:FtsX-like permease family protein [Rapidithrix thailandica]|uniref:FtsX-like permease family protein n=1 Tax=Rapidithrix thailandica TaxID=413964 RepID=A0AAW9RSI0_9BACT